SSHILRDSHYLPPLPTRRSSDLIARISGASMNQKDPAKIVARMSGGFLIIEDASLMNEETVEQLNRAMEFRTDCMILIIEDEKADRKSTRLNSSHVSISYAVFCL